MTEELRQEVVASIQPSARIPLFLTIVIPPVWALAGLVLPLNAWLVGLAALQCWLSWLVVASIVGSSYVFGVVERLGEMISRTLKITREDTAKTMNVMEDLRAAMRSARGAPEEPREVN